MWNCRFYFCLYIFKIEKPFSPSISRTKVNRIRLSTPWRVNKSGCAPKGSWWHHDSATFFRLVRQCMGQMTSQLRQFRPGQFSEGLWSPSCYSYILQKAGVPKRILLTLYSYPAHKTELIVCWSFVLGFQPTRSYNTAQLFLVLRLAHVRALSGVFFWSVVLPLIGCHCPRKGFVVKWPLTHVSTDSPRVCTSNRVVL